MQGKSLLMQMLYFVGITHILRTFTFTCTYILCIEIHTYKYLPTYLPTYITYIDYQPQSGLGFRPSTKNKLNCALNLCWWWRNSCCRKHKVLHSSMCGFDIPYWLPCGTWIAIPPPPVLPWRTNVSWMRYLFTAIFTRSCLKQAAGSCLCGSSIPLMSTSTFHVFSMRTSARLFMPKAYRVWLDIWVKTYMTIQLCCVWNFEIYSFFMYNIICDIKGSESAVTPWNFPPFFPSDHPVLPLSCKPSKDECWLTASCNCRVAENGRMTSSASITCTACTATHFGFRTVDLLRLQNLKSFIFEVHYHSVQYKVWTKNLQ